MRNDAVMIRASGTRANGFDRSLDLQAADLSRVVAPTLAVAGTEDPVGGVDVVKSIVSMMPNARATVVEGAGHLPWLDDPIAVGRAVEHFMSEGVAQASNRGPERRSS
jgi:pimeloyl-ACP methyl ester carboxylesterase